MPRNDDLPPSGKVQRFIQYYLDTRDLHEAAKMLRISDSYARQIYRLPGIKEKIERSFDRIELEEARLRAKARALTRDKLDAALDACIEKEKGLMRLKAIELGYKSQGFLKDKVEHSGENGGPLVFTLERIEAKK